MKRKLLLRCIMGAPIGLAINVLITIAVSFAVGDGNFYPVRPELISDCGNEWNAVFFQAMCSLLYGAVWAGATVIWEKENWSLLAQTAAHFLICSVATFPAAYFMRWMDHNVISIVGYFGTFAGIYAAIWSLWYFKMKKRICQMNAKIGRKNQSQ